MKLDFRRTGNVELPLVKIGRQELNGGKCVCAKAFHQPLRT
jgi:hypothetical protein